MTKTKSYALVILAHMVILIIYLYGNAFMHEQFHKANAQNFGCINGSITLDWRGGHYTCFKYSEFQSTEQRQTMNFLDSQNEIVSYNLNNFGMLLVGLSLVTFVSLVHIFGRDDDE